MVLHLIVRRAAAADIGLPATEALAWSDDRDDADTWGDLAQYLVQDDEC